MPSPPPPPFHMLLFLYPPPWLVHATRVRAGRECWGENHVAFSRGGGGGGGGALPLNLPSIASNCCSSLLQALLRAFRSSLSVICALPDAASPKAVDLKHGHLRMVSCIKCFRARKIHSKFSFPLGTASFEILTSLRLVPVILALRDEALEVRGHLSHGR